MGIAWNGYICSCRRISLRHFARIHGVAYETWRREHNRGAAYRTIRNGNRWTYAEYDLEKARDSIRTGKANMVTRMKLTVGMAILFRHFVVRLRCSPYDARQGIMGAFPDKDVPCLRTSGRMKARKALPVIRSATTDNGCKFLSQRRLDRVFKAETYYTRACASYEKGAIENCNRLVRRWHPKGTDFNRLTRREIQQLEDWINSIHRESLKGETAHAYDQRLAKAA